MLSAGIALIFLGSSVILGWEIGSEFLTSVGSGWVTMKQATASSFIFYGLYLVLKSQNKKKLEVWQHVCLLWIICLINIPILAYFLHFEGVFGPESTNAAFSVAPNVPSLATAYCFDVVCIHAVMKNKVILYTNVILALTAIAGYVLNVPFLYFSFPGISSAMAIHTSIGHLIGAIGHVKK